MDRKRGRKKRGQEVDRRRGEKLVYTMDRKRERRDGEEAPVKEGGKDGKQDRKADKQGVRQTLASPAGKEG